MDSDEIKQHLLFGLLVFEMPGLGMKFQIDTDLRRKHLQRAEDGHINKVNQSCTVGLGVYLEHTSESRIAISATAVTEDGLCTRNVVVKQNHFHLILQQVHHIFNGVCGSLGKREQHIIIDFGLLHGSRV